MTTEYYLIDMENLRLRALTGLRLPGSDAQIRIFISNAIHTATEEVAEDILNSRAQIETYFCHTTGKNAMDFQITAYLGAALERQETRRVAIISEDRGYAVLREYTEQTRRDVQFFQGGSIMEAYVAFHEDCGRIYTKKKGQSVDFKQIMAEVRTKQQFAQRLAQILDTGTAATSAEDAPAEHSDTRKESEPAKRLHAAGRLNASGREEVLLREIIRLADSAPDKGTLYRSLTHLLGAATGRRVYWLVREQYGR